MQFVSKFLPDHLPKSMRDYRDKYEHHLILKMGGKGVDEARAFLKEYFHTTAARFSSATPKKPKPRCCTVSPSLPPPSATVPCTTTKWRTWSRWISPCAATTATGLKNCRRKSTINHP
ncbi:D-lactate dehydrogenase [Neisseria gonorrhoeae]|uniref:D-lactate dehydrogenase n=1 Tax=Neisseria gonorrhoeae TaxID=485 RepID=A0A378VYK7_NEIGO|nr:D-lactate dehydrogenase [Neisseria gonorrhoeae]